MEISGPACNLRINDNPDNYNIQDELNAINEPTPGWVQLRHERIQLINDILNQDNAKLRKRITTLEKRWKAVRKEITKVSKQPFGQDWIPATDVLDLMTKITRKIK